VTPGYVTRFGSGKEGCFWGGVSTERSSQSPRLLPSKHGSPSEEAKPTQGSGVSPGCGGRRRGLTCRELGDRWVRHTWRQGHHARPALVPKMETLPRAGCTDEVVKGSRGERVGVWGIGGPHPARKHLGLCSAGLPVLRPSTGVTRAALGRGFRGWRPWSSLVLH